MKKIKIGYAPTRRFVFSKEDAFKYKKLILEKIKQYDIEIIDLEGINSEGLLFDSEDDVKKVIGRFKAENVDAVFFPHCNFGTEDAVSKVAKAIGKPVLLWGPRDEAPLKDGMRLRDTQCGLFATGKILRRFNVPFTYIPNCSVEDELFERGFKNFIAAVNVVKAFNKLRILQISTRPAGFWTMMYNEGELLEKFGIQVYPLTLIDVKKRLTKIYEEDGSDLKQVVKVITEKMDCSEVNEEEVKKLAALKLAISQYVSETNSSAVAIQCWSAMQDSMGIMPCLANSLLTDEGIPVTCETDVHGAITAVMAREAAMGTTSPFFADMTVRHPENDNGELLFHCGNFPLSLAKEGTSKLRHHFLFEDHAPGTHEAEIKGGDMTIVRFDGDHGEYSLLLGKAKGIDGPYSRGSYVWVEVDDWVKWERKLVEGPYVHHCVGIHSDIIPVLYEAQKYIKGFKLDLVDVTEEQIIAWLNGK